MKKIYALLLSAAALPAAVSCDKEMLPADELLGRETILTATVDETESRTSLDGITVRWTAGDKINVNAVNSTALASGNITNNGKKAAFSINGEVSAPYHAIYPAAAYVADSYADGKATLKIPSYQTRSGNGFDGNAAIMLAKGDAATLPFSHAVSYLKMTFNTPVTSVEVSALGSEILSGQFETDFENALVPVKGQVSGSVSISASSPVAGPWIVAVPAQEYSGFVITAMKSDGKVMMVKAQKEIQAQPGVIYNLTGSSSAAFSANRNSYFVKPGGSGDGTSWDKAASFASLITKIKSVNANGWNFYLAGGTYNSSNGFSAEISMTQASATRFAIFGGYPADATGTSLGGRDVQGNPTVIDAEKARRILVLNGAGIDITLNGLTLKNASSSASGTNGTAIVIANVTSALFEDCTLEDNDGRALRLTKPSVWRRCSFIRNCGSTAGVADVTNETTFENCYFEGNTGTNAGALTLGSYTLNLSGNVFKGNIQGDWNENTCTSTSYGGGAVYCSGANAVINSENDSFLENKGGVGGAVSVGHENTAKASASLHFTGTLFRKNRAGRAPDSPQYGIGGGALYLNGGTTTLEACTIRENYETSGNTTYAGGAGIMVTGSTALIANHCEFINNRAASSASAIYCFNGTTAAPVKLRDCIFDGKSSQNAGSRGGALRTYGDNSRIYADRCVFKSHIVKSGYGAVAMTSSGGMAFNNCTFYNNKTVNASHDYTTIYVNSTKLMVITNCSFWDNPVGDESPSKFNALINFGASPSPTILINNLIVNKRASSAEDYAITGNKPSNTTSSANVVSALGANWTSDAGMWSQPYNTDFGLSWSSSLNLITNDGELAGYSRPASVDYSPVLSKAKAFYEWVTESGFTVDARGYARTGSIYPGSYQRDNSAPTYTMKAMSLNIMLKKYDGPNPATTSWNNRKAAILSMLSGANPDILGLNECDWTQRNYFTSNLSAYSSVGQSCYSTATTNYGEDPSNPIYYKTSVFERLDWGTFWLSATPSTPSYTWEPDPGTPGPMNQRRTCTWLKLRHKASGRTLMVAQTHFANYTTNSKGEVISAANSHANSVLLIVDKLNEMASDIPVILMGDFNNILNASFAAPLHELLLEGRRNCTTKDTGFTYNDFSSDTDKHKTFDHIFYKDLKGTRFIVDRNAYSGVTYISDHWPVSAEFKIEAL